MFNFQLSTVEFSECDIRSPEDNEYGGADESDSLKGFRRVRTMYVGLLLGGAFFLLLSFIACCFLCPCSWCIFAKWMTKQGSGVHGHGVSEVERSTTSSDLETSSLDAQCSRHRTVTVSSIVIMCDNQNHNSIGFRNAGVRDPPPPYPGKSKKSTPCHLPVVEEYPPPPPYSPSLR